MLRELKGNKEAQVALMLLVAEKNSFSRIDSVKEFLVLSGMSSKSEAYLLFKQARKMANLPEEMNVFRIRYINLLDRAFTKAVGEYEKTGKNMMDIIALGSLVKEIAIVQQSLDIAKGIAGGPTIQNNINLDQKSLEAVAQELARNTVDVQPDGFKQSTTRAVPQQP